jgi:hypothetical protein
LTFKAILKARLKHAILFIHGITQVQQSINQNGMQ